MNNQEKQESKRLPGFYIALCCCVIAVGVAGYFTERNATDTNDTVTNAGENFNVAESEIVSNEDDTSVAVSEITEVAEDNSVDLNTESNLSITKPDFPEIETVMPGTETYQTLNEPIEETAVIITNPEFVMPVTGDILAEFSKELTYNNALCDWRSHSGVDIAAEIGSSVLAIHDGTVTKVSSDEMGKYVVIDHGNGFIARYSRLSGTESCEVGKEIKSGEVIGTICEGDGENITAPHLHLELYKNDECVNPMEYIKQ